MTSVHQNLQLVLAPMTQFVGQPEPRHPQFIFELEHQDAAPECTPWQPLLAKIQLGADQRRGLRISLQHAAGHHFTVTAAVDTTGNTCWMIETDTASESGWKGFSDALHGTFVRELPGGLRDDGSWANALTINGEKQWILFNDVGVTGVAHLLTTEVDAFLNRGDIHHQMYGEEALAA